MDKHDGVGSIAISLLFGMAMILLCTAINIDVLGAVISSNSQLEKSILKVEAIYALDRYSVAGYKLNDMFLDADLEEVLESDNAVYKITCERDANSVDKLKIAFVRLCDGMEIESRLVVSYGEK